MQSSNHQNLIQENFLSKFVAMIFIEHLWSLYNNNKEQYNLGLKQFIEYSSESIELSNDIAVKIINLDFNSSIYENSEGKRQLALKLKQQYDKYILLGKKIFGI